MEDRRNPISGVFRVIKKEADELDDSDDEDGGDDLQWLDYKEINSMSSGKSFVSFKRPKVLLGSLTDINTRKMKTVEAPLHLSDPWWECTILRTRQQYSGSRLHRPADCFALAYKLRNDPRMHKDKIVPLMMTKICNSLDAKKEEGSKQESSKSETSYSGRKEESTVSAAVITVAMKDTCSRVTDNFFAYLRDRHAEDEVDFDNFEMLVEDFCRSFPESEQREVLRWKRWMVESPYSEFVTVKKAKSYPKVFNYLPQLLPNQFTEMIQLEDNKLGLLEKAIQERPWVLAFKPVMSRECKVLGCETSSNALIKSGLMAKIPEVPKDALYIYEYLKSETKKNGHTGIKYSEMREKLDSTVTKWKQALKFLEENHLVKMKKEDMLSVVYLYTLWKAEKKIAKGIQKLIKLNKAQPWKLNVDWEREDIQDLKADSFQWKAAHLIAEQPVVAISGKGGCGKTHVVTKVITSARVERHSEKSAGDNTTAASKTGTDEDDYVWSDDENFPEDKCPDKLELLLTAPTGKAANLLGKRADKTGYTLHQVIFSYRMLKPGTEWKHKDVNTLVVDECSLVSVSTFSLLLDILQDNADLRRVVLLGDIRQLPSIEPGNFLSDLFESMKKLDCSVELKRNHRSESELIVDNATRISNMCDPQFDEERKFTMCRVPEGDGRSNEFAEQDTIVTVQRLLGLDALKSDVNSQFVCFQRKTCESINDICCYQYSGHRIKEGKKFKFQPQDKICCTKNGWVTKQNYNHGIMQAEKGTADGNSSRYEGSKDKSQLSSGSGRETVNSTGDLNDSLEVTGLPTEKDSETNRLRLCNGEIFFIIDDREIIDERGTKERYLYLSDMDKDEPNEFWVNYRELKRECRLRHAWARTIHTFQGSETENVVYVVGNNKWQTWQHVYTAITRGKKAVFIVGQESALTHAVHKKERWRRTSLRRQLREYLEKTKCPEFKPDLTITASQVVSSPAHVKNIPVASCSHLLPTVEETEEESEFSEKSDFSLVQPGSSHLLRQPPHMRKALSQSHVRTAVPSETYTRVLPKVEEEESEEDLFEEIDLRTRGVPKNSDKTRDILPSQILPIIPLDQQTMSPNISLVAGDSRRPIQTGFTIDTPQCSFLKSSHVAERSTQFSSTPLSVSQKEAVGCMPVSTPPSTQFTFTNKLAPQISKLVLDASLSGSPSEPGRNESQNSQWSEVDDSQYLNLDIDNLEVDENLQNTPPQQITPKQPLTPPQQQNQKPSDRNRNSILDSTSKTPEQDLTQLIKASEQSPHSSPSQKRPLLVEPSTSTNEPYSPTKRKVNPNQLSVSPLKRSFAKLDFK